MNGNDAAEQQPARRRIVLGLWLALLSCTAMNIAFMSVLLVRGDSLEDVSQGTGLSLTAKLGERTGNDSWKPMAAAFEREQKHPGEMYWIFFVKRLRFQYPPSALLVMNFVPLPLTMELRDKLGTPSLLALFVSIGFSIAILLSLSPGFSADRAGRRWVFPALCMLLGVALGITFYPLTKGHTLGQIQIYLGALVAVALFLRVRDLRFLAGVCLGLCCLLKPQYGLVLLWAGLRRELRFLFGCLLVVAVGETLALLKFGMHNHLEYLKVLRELSRSGESFWPNQSVNGLLHRFLGNGEPVKWLARELPPYHSVVYYGTLASSVVLLGLALFWPTDRRWRGSAVDLSAMLVAATLASPIAWEHHYGAFFPMFAVVAPWIVDSRRQGLLLLCAYTLMASELLRPELLLPSRWLGLLSSHIFFGGLILFGLLLVTRAGPHTRYFGWSTSSASSLDRTTATSGPMPRASDAARPGEV